MRRLGWVRAVALAGCLAGWGVAWTQATIVALPTPLLPGSVQGVQRNGDGVAGNDPAQADAAATDVLRENGLDRFSRAQYGSTQVEALQFHDATGAYSAFTFYLKGARSLKPGEGAAQQVAVVGDRTVVLAQTVVLIAEKGAEPKIVNGIVEVLPRIRGPRSQPPLLPTFFPTKGLVRGSLRYAQGPVGYTAMGGTLSVGQLGWEKNAEAAMAEYADKRGKETLTLLLYPTPQIAGEHAREVKTEPGGNDLKVRREGELVIVAAGSFSADAAQNFIENVHVNSVVSFDKPMPVEFQTEVQKTYSLLVSIAILSGFGCLAAVMLGLFFGGGRAIIRKLQGKDAAADVEFLSLHLDNQNKPVRFDPPAS